MPEKLILGISLKMYFGYQQTLEWSQRIASVLREHPLASSKDAGFFLFPSTPAIAGVQACFQGTSMKIGAQDMSSCEPGAWTGETSAAMLAEMGCQVVELGHAERRRHFHESQDLINRKIHISLNNGLTPVICIGEDDQVTPAQAMNIAITEAKAIIDALPEGLRHKALVFAWEPKWAIGAAQPASVAYIRTVCRGLKEALNEMSPESKVIYGGSAGPGLLTQLWPDVDGLFLGRFAHQPTAFQSILDEAAELLTS
ncbi:triosephosphate isomerase [Buttiauxella sp. B2]|uniref:triose-phosphate isomerase family protein n=1 Tax=Buttiauxella sp. B2 TaxID=2587812 RepID=UPI00111DD87D|nr:triose-phosphate isomerase family protein [Buttiauxella sp. B2]TNV11100.1 triosephosphate isomerase [Buttiauxella sp. B2]